MLWDDSKVIQEYEICFDFAHVFVLYLDQITNSFVADNLLSLLGWS